MPGGRPTKYKPEYAKQLIDYGRAGKSLTQFAASIEVSRESLHEWAKRHKPFSVAVKKHRQLAESYWETVGHSAMFGKLTEKGGEKVSFNPTVWIFYMKARFRWADRVIVDKPDEANDGFFFDETD